MCRLGNRLLAEEGAGGRKVRWPSVQRQISQVGGVRCESEQVEPRIVSDGLHEYFFATTFIKALLSFIHNVIYRY